MGRLDGKVALITGGSRGIGRAIAAAYIREGAKVFICGRNEAALETTVAAIRVSGSEISGRRADIVKVREVKRLVAEVCRVYGTIHVLVNNAGILGPREFLVDYPLSSWEEVLKKTKDSRPRTRRSEEHTSELQSRPHLVCRLL